MEIKKILLMLIGVMFLSAMPVNANPEDFIAPYDTPNTATPDLVYFWHTQDGVNEMDNMVNSKEFQDYLQKKGINKEDYELELISPYSNTPNNVMVRNSTHKWYYTLKSTGSRNTRKTNARDTPNYFTLHNNCGQTIYYVGVGLMRLYNYVPIGVHQVHRWNLGNGGELNYWPDPDYTHVNLRFKPNKNDWFDVIKRVMPLGTWHHAYMSRNDANGFYWRF